MTDYTRSFTRGVYLRYISFACMGVLGLAVQKVLTDAFSTEIYGVYSIFFSIINYSLMLFTAGLPEVVQRFVPQYLAKKEHNNLRKLFQKTSGLVFLFALIPFGILLMAEPFLTKILHLPDFPFHLYLTAGALIVLGNMIFFNNGVLTGFASYGPRTAGEISATTLRLILIYACGHFFPGIQSLLLFIALAYLFHFCFTFFSIRRNFDLLEKTDEAVHLDFKELGLFSASRFFHTATASILDYSFDIFMITWLLGDGGPAQAGLYGLGAAMALSAISFNPGRICFDVLKTTLLLKHDHAEDFDFVLKLTRMYIKMVGFFYVPLIAGVAGLGHTFVGLFFRADYFSAAHVFVATTSCMAVALTFIVPFYIVTDVLKLKRVHVYERLFLIYNIGMNFVLIPRIGILGAALSTGTTWILMAVFLYVYLKRLVAIRIDWAAFLKMCVNAIPMSLLFYFGAAHIHSLPALVVFAMAGLILYFASSFFIKILDPAERDILNNALNRKIIFF